MGKEGCDDCVYGLFFVRSLSEAFGESWMGSWETCIVAYIARPVEA